MGIAIINYILLAIIIFFLIAVIFRWLWNITMPQVFGLKEITYWQAFRLLLIAGILFGGIYFKTASAVAALPRLF